jgi:hypothetical protein
VRLGGPGFGETVVVVRMGGATVDEWGDTVGGVEERFPIVGCAFAPLKQGENASPDGAALLDGFTVYMPYGADVTANDLLEIRGRLFHVDGVPGVWVNPYSVAYPRGVEVVVRGS